MEPTYQELSNAHFSDDFKVVEETYKKWRHGYFVTTIFKRISDNTFWRVRWLESTDGETNTLRDCELDDGDVHEVHPHQVVRTFYTTELF